jgi:hypothetical protein
MGDPCELRNNGSFESFVFVHGTAQEKIQEVEKLNRQKDIWGWKQPFGVEALNNLPKGIRDLYCVFVFRDLVALLQSYRHHANASREDAAMFVSQHNARLWEASQRTTWPSYLVSYERMKIAPYDFVMPLCLFLGLDLPMYQKATAMARISHVGGYINMPPDYGWPPKFPPGSEVEVSP